MNLNKQSTTLVSSSNSIDITQLLKPLLENSLTRKIKTGDIVFYQGEAPRSACILKSGIIKVYNITAAGEEQLVNFQLPGEVFPTPWVFSKTASVLYFYEALSDTEMYLLPRDELLAYIRSKNDLLNVFLDQYVNNYISSVMRITALEQPKAREKIMYTMYFLVQRYGQELDDARVQLKIKLTHQHIANLVGLTRETTAVEMKKLKTAGVIDYVRQKYVINTTKLLEMMGEDHFKDLDLN
jgi:CRP/FNR family cyclic AMP-dependent transcriptional regulator